MGGNGLNRTNGVFDIEKEASIAVGIAIGDLMDLKIVSNEDADRAEAIGIEIFLVFRSAPELSAANAINIEAESEKLARIIIGALIEKSIVKKENGMRAIEVAAEELLVRWSMESLY